MISFRKLSIIEFNFCIYYKIYKNRLFVNLITIKFTNHLFIELYYSYENNVPKFKY